MESTLAEAKMTAKSLIHQFAQSVGITIDGQKPWDIQIHNEKFYNRVLHNGSLGLGESYLEKWWDCERLDLFFDRVLRAQLYKQVDIPLHFKFKQLLACLVNLQTKARAKLVARRHYDLGNDLFIAMLDKRMIYSCGYWKEATNLDDAQTAKLDLICQKLQLQPGMRLLDIGCGWGGLAKYAAEQYGANVVGVTISEQQWQYAKKACEGLNIDIRLQDYRDVKEKFDRVVSVGMFEHVGRHNYDSFFHVVNNALANDESLFLLHTIGANQTAIFGDEWIAKYIFPNGLVPSIAHISKATEGLFIMEDWHNFGADYDKTLMAWHENFTRHWNELKSKYDERFRRMWNYYLLSCAGTFRARTNQLWQVVFSRRGMVGGYRAPR